MKRKKLRIGLLLGGHMQPLWRYKIIEKLSSEDFIDVRLVINNTQNNSLGKSFKETIINYKKYFFLIIYKKIEQIFQKPPHVNTHKLKDIRKILPDTTSLNVKPISSKYRDKFSDGDIEQIREHNLDVIIRFGFRILSGKILSSAKYGIWSYHHGNNSINRGGPPAIWEVIEKHPTTGVILQVLNEDLDNGLILHKSIIKTKQDSILKNKTNIYLNSIPILPNKLKELYELGEEKFFNKVEKENQNPSFYTRKLYKKRMINNYMMFKYIISYFYQKISSRITKALYKDQWFLLFSLKKDISSSFWRFKKIIPPKDRFYADPFPITKNNNHYVFFEEFTFNNNKGHISLIKIDGKGDYSKVIKIIDKKYHLSYPHIFKVDNTYFMIPESKENSTIELYKCTDFPEKWEFQLNLMENIQAVDTTIFYHKKKYWLFTNIIQQNGMSSGDNLFLFFSNELETKNWNAHPMNPIVSDCRRARSAGNIFIHNGLIIRPSQNSEKHYGYGFNMNKISILNEFEYEEEVVDKIDPLWDKNLISTHTFNFEKNITIIDACRKIIRFF